MLWNAKILYRDIYQHIAWKLIDEYVRSNLVFYNNEYYYM